MAETPGMSQMAVQWNRLLREQWTKDIEDALTRLDPYAARGRLTRKSLPSGILRDVGDYSDIANYAPGDVVRGSDGRDYRAVIPTIGNDPVDDTGEWEPIQGWNPNHTHDGTTGQGPELDASHTHESVVLGPAVGAIHWDEAGLVDLIEATAVTDPSLIIIPPGDCHDGGSLVDLLNDLFCRLSSLEAAVGGFGFTPFGTGSFGS